MDLYKDGNMRLNKKKNCAEKNFNIRLERDREIDLTYKNIIFYY